MFQDLRQMKIFKFQIMRLAFAGTKYEALLSLYNSTTCTFIGDEPAVAKVSNSSEVTLFNLL